MSDPLLVLDVHYLCHRAFHTTRELSWKERPTGVIFGFFQSIITLKNELQTERVAFCFEHPHLFRREVFPEYKRRRLKERTPEEQEAKENFAIQIAELRCRYLPSLGYKNIFRYRGMESDDIMAAIAGSVKDQEKERVIIVTSDQDLLQCLSSNVAIYSPQKKKLLTERWFYNTYGIAPHRWAMVKAIAGCKSDCVPGIKGVGEKSAVKFIQGELSEKSRACALIVSENGKETMLRNRKLVRLPYAGCPVPEIQEDTIIPGAWQEVMHSLGMRSLVPKIIPPTAKGKRYGQWTPERF